MEKKFFQKKLQIVFTPCFLFWTLIDEGKAWGKNVFFQVFKKMEKSCTWCIFEKKREFFDNENQKCQCENMKNSFFSILIIKTDRDLHFCHRKIAVSSEKSSRNESEFQCFPKMTTFLGSYLAILSNAGPSDFGR